MKLRSEQGGHSIPIETSKRRYERGLNNLFNLYLHIIDNWWLYDNSFGSAQMIGWQSASKSPEIVQSEIWNSLKNTFGPR